MFDDICMIIYYYYIVVLFSIYYDPMPGGCINIYDVCAAEFVATLYRREDHEIVEARCFCRY